MVLAVNFSLAGGEFMNSSQESIRFTGMNCSQNRFLKGIFGFLALQKEPIAGLYVLLPAHLRKFRNTAGVKLTQTHRHLGWLVMVAAVVACVTIPVSSGNGNFEWVSSHSVLGLLYT